MNRYNLHIIGYIFILMLLEACGLLQGDEEQLPPGMAYLNQAHAGHDFDAFIVESTVKSELFRRRLLSGNDPNFISADLVAEAIMKFRQLSYCYKVFRQSYHHVIPAKAGIQE